MLHPAKQTVSHIALVVGRVRHHRSPGMNTHESAACANPMLEEAFRE